MADSADADCMQELAFKLSAVEGKHLPWNNELDVRGTEPTMLVCVVYECIEAKVCTL